MRLKLMLCGFYSARNTAPNVVLNEAEESDFARFLSRETRKWIFSLFILLKFFHLRN